MVTFHIITIFPKIFNSYFNESIIKRAQDNQNIKINIYNLRDWAIDKRGTVDDTPYGGGAGMLIMVEPLYRAIKSIKGQILPKHRVKIVLLSAKGAKWKQKKAQEFSKIDDLIIICGRYEGVDERIQYFIDEEVSIGDYVLTGGEIGAMVLVDSISRLIPGVLGNRNSVNDESHNTEGVLEYPQYTKPEIFKVKDKEYKVPKVLLSGNHKKIKEWREKNKNRPNL